jgi:ribosome maturation factor RimP
VDVVQKITDIVTPSLEALGYHIVQIKLSEGARRKTLMVMAERLDEQMMGFDDCTDISRTISALLDVDDPISDAYDLEVCSPGLDRPLTRLADYDKYKGYEAKCETMIPLDGRKRFRGTIGGTQDNNILLELDTGTVALSFNNIRSAKLVVNDTLLATAMKKEPAKQKKQGGGGKAKRQPKKKQSA